MENWARGEIAVFHPAYGLAVELSDEFVPLLLVFVLALVLFCADVVEGVDFLCSLW